MPGNVNITTSSVPQGFCFTDWQTSWPTLVALLSGNLPGDPSFNFGSATPSAANQGKAWFRLNADGSPDRWYVFTSGVWAAKHPAAQGTIIMWEGAEVDIPTFDGGEVAAVTAFTGPMWERVTEMDGRFPVGPGTLASTAVIAIGDQGGEEKHSLTVAEIAPHTHTVRAVLADTDGGSQVQRLRNMTSTEVSSQQTVTDSAGGSIVPPATVAVVEGHNTMPPYNSVWFLRKTARTYYRV